MLIKCFCGDNLLATLRVAEVTVVSAMLRGVWAQHWNGHDDGIAIIVGLDFIIMSVTHALVVVMSDLVWDCC